MLENPQILVAKTFHGLEPVVAAELEALGAEDIRTERRAVTFRGDLELLYKANLHLRTALRINVPVHEFEARTPEELYKKALAFKWHEMFDVDKSFAIDFNVNSSVFTHSQFAALKLKDAIVDQFRNELRKRPDVDREDPDVLLNLRIYHDTKCVVSLDSSGQPLHRRGYRQTDHRAPINEVLAAGIIALTGYDGTQPFYDLMCGSGTFLVEAASKALDVPPQVDRDFFGFKHWKNFDEALYKRLKAEASEFTEKDIPPIIGLDSKPYNIPKAQETIRNAGFANFIKVGRGNFFRQEGLEPGLLVLNPPYGERMELEDAQNYYKKLGDQLKFHFAGFDVWIITANLEAAKFIGLRPSKKIVMYNGPLECRLLNFQVYAGSKRDQKSTVA